MSANADRPPNCILSVYPLAREFKARIMELAGAEALVVTGNELRQRGAVGSLRFLRTRKVDRVFIPIEEQDSTALLPILKLIASMMRSRSVVVVGSDLEQKPVRRLDVATSSVNLVGAILAGLRAKRRAAAKVQELLAAPRIEVTASDSRNLLFLNANLWFGVKAGGSVGHISGVVNGLLELGHPVQFASCGGRMLVKEQASYFQLEPPRHFGTTMEYDCYRFGMDALDQLLAETSKRGLGLIYQRLSICNFTGVELSRKLRIPLIIEYNGSEVWVSKNWGRPLAAPELAEKAEEVNLRHAHLVVTISDVLRDELIARKVPPERIVTYPNCIDPVTFDPARFGPAEIAEVRRRHGIAPDAIVATFVGTFGQWHGASVLAEAIRRMLDERSSWVDARKLHFLFVGDGLKMPEVRQILGRYVDDPRVTLAGLVPQAQAPSYLAASDILCSPHVANADGSRFFGSPTKLFEYMAMSRAILASDLDQIGEVLKGSLSVDRLPEAAVGPTGNPPALLARPGSADEIVRGMEFLVDRPEWRQFLGANARRLALSRYTWRHHVEAIVERARELGLAHKS